MGWIARMPSREKARTVFLSALFLLLLGGAAAAVSILLLLQSEKWVIHTHEIQAAIGDTDAAISRAARARGKYANTRDAQSLQAFRASLSEIPAKTRRLGVLFENDAGRTGLCSRLETLIAARVALFERPIVPENPSPHDVQEQNDLRQQGLAVSTEISALTQQMRDEEQQLLAVRAHRSAGLLGLTAIILVVTFVVAVALLVVHYRLLSAELRARQSAEAEVRAQNKQLDAANKELETFSYSVSHDLRAPLRAIDGFSTVLLEDCAHKLAPEEMDHLHRVREAAARMAQLIHDLLELSRTSRCAMVRESVDLSCMARDISDELHQAEPDRRATIVIAPDLVVNGDPSLLRTVLENLLGNAWKFSARRQDAQMELGVSRHDSQIIYFVRDNGVGFDMKYADKLFDPFQRFHDPGAFPGTGVGLASVQRIIHRHQGRIWAESAEGKGATFYFVLNAAGGGTDTIPAMAQMQY